MYLNNIQGALERLKEVSQSVPELFYVTVV